MRAASKITPARLLESGLVLGLMERPCAGLQTPHAARAGTWNGVRVASKITPSQELQI